MNNAGYLQSHVSVNVQGEKGSKGMDAVELPTEVYVKQNIFTDK